MIEVYRILAVIGFFVLSYFIGKKFDFLDDFKGFVFIFLSTLSGVIFILILSILIMLIHTVSCLLIK